jgi:adenosine deaminase
MVDPSALPKVLLHDHLDGGVRPATVIALARSIGYETLPHAEVDALTAWFHQGGSSSLERYLEAFTHTFGVMQEPEGLRRVTYEAGEDLAADGVVYAEIRFGPSLHTGRGLTRQEVIAAVLEGARAAEEDFGLPIRIIVDALRQDTDSVDVARAAVEFAGQGVVGFDLAGPEAGFPASMHAEALEVAAAGGLHLTIHAGEGAGVESIVDAIGQGAERLGHGARIVEDTTVREGEIVELGEVAQRVRDDGIALELCPTSNLHTGMYADAADHPIGMLHRAGFAVTLNTDNRLMSGITLSDEYDLVAAAHGFGIDDFRVITQRALDAAFCDDETRERIQARLDLGYAS